MSNTIYASFKYVTLAEKAAGALLDHGVRPDNISLVRNDDPGVVTNMQGGAGATVGGAGTMKASGAGMPSAARVSQHGPETAGHPSDPASGYEEQDIEAMRQKQHAEYRDPQIAYPVGTAGVGFVNAPSSGFVDSEAVPLNTSPHDPEEVAKYGITTTTGADAKAGAVVGTEFGIGVGILAGVASILVPGVGLVLGGGALAMALGGVAASAGAGAAAGAVVGYLKDQGVDEHVATELDRTLSSGGALLAVQYPSGDVGEIEIRVVLDKYGAASLGAVGSKGYVA